MKAFFTLLCTILFCQSIYSQNHEVVQNISSVNYYSDEFLFDAEDSLLVVGDKGKVHIHLKDSSLNEWRLDSTINFPNTGESNWTQVSLSGNWLAVSMRSKEYDTLERAGIVFLLEKDIISETWEIKQTILPPAPKQYGYFGHSLKLQDSILIISGNSTEIDSIQALYNYALIGGVWVLQEEFFPPGEEQQFNPYSIRVNGDWLFVGDPHDRIPLGNNINYYTGGAVYIYKKKANANGWNFFKRIIIPENGGDFFHWLGYDIETIGDVLVVGAPQSTGSTFRSGSVYLFEKDEGGTNNWGRTQKLIPEPQIGNIDISFGNCISIHQNEMMISAPTSPKASIYRFTNTGSSWEFNKKISPVGISQRSLGNDIFYDGDNFLVTYSDSLYSLGPAAVLLNGDRGVCEGDTVFLQMVFPDNSVAPYEVKYTINTNEYNLNDVQNGDTITIIANGGEFEVEFVEVTDANGDTLNIAKETKLVTLPVHNMDLRGDATTCEGQATELYLKIPRPDGVPIATHFFSRFNIYLSENGKDTVFNNVGPNHRYWASPTQNTSYQVTKIETSFGCTRTDDFIRNKIDIAVRPSPTASLRLADDTLCLGESIQATSTSSNSDGIKWFLNNQQISIANTITYPTSIDGNFNLSLIASKGDCFDTMQANIRIDFQPTASFYASDFCLNDSTSLNFTGIKHDSSEFLWNVDGVPVSTEENIKILFPEIGQKIISLEASNSEECTSIFYDTITINPSPVADFEIIGNCQFSPIALEFTGQLSSAQDEILWGIYNEQNQTISTSSEPNFENSFANSGNYSASLLLSNEFGCESELSRNFNVEYNPKPSITPNPLSINRLTASDASVYQWYINNIPVLDALGGRDKTLKVFDIGWYKVTTFTSNNCANTSDSIYADMNVVLSLTGEQLEHMKVYPNPGTKDLHLQFDTPINTALNLSIVASDGLELGNQYLSRNTTEYFINTDKLPKGVYFLIFSNNEGLLYTHKWIKE